MMPAVPRDPNTFPRAYTVIAAIIQQREGKRISSQRVQQCHDNAIRKMRKAFEKMGLGKSDLR